MAQKNKCNRYIIKRKEDRLRKKINGFEIKIKRIEIKLIKN